MAQDLRKVNDIESLMTYFSENWDGPLTRMTIMILMTLHMILKPKIWV